jgi:hypothetical protein
LISLMIKYFYEDFYSIYLLLYPLKNPQQKKHCIKKRVN